MNHHFAHFRRIAKPEVQPLAVLGQKSFARPERFGQGAVCCGRALIISGRWATTVRLGGVRVNLDAGTDRVSICAGPVTHKPQGKKSVAAGTLIPHQSQARCGAVRYPEVEVTVLVPVAEGHPPSVIRKIKATGNRYVGKITTSGVEIRAVSLVSTPRGSRADRPATLHRRRGERESSPHRPAAIADPPSPVQGERVETSRRCPRTHHQARGQRR